MTLLIVADSCDVHANIVEHALHAHGVQTTRLASDRLPREQTLSHVFDEGVERYHINGTPASSIRTVWLRRRGQPGNYEAGLDAVDDKISRQETHEFWKFCQFALPPQARHVNPLPAKLQAQSKIFQLRMAQHVGLKIPRTIISNDPAEVVAFAAQAGDNAFKSLSPVHWVSPEGSSRHAIHALFTAKVSQQDILDHLPSIRRAPGIFQQLIPAVREYRVTLFGTSCIAVTVESQHAYDDLHDWRAGPHHTLKVMPARIPDALRECLMQFMDATQLAFGAFDILETADDEFYFLEVNEAGQFLWIEHQNPDVAVLKPFCDFLIGRSDWAGALALGDVAMAALPAAPANP